MPKRTAIRDLRADAIDSASVNYDWMQGFGEKWECWEASRCDECNAIVIGREGDRHRDCDSDSTCLGSIHGEGPMMSYYYPLEIHDVEEAARALVDTCLCVVSVEQHNGERETGLALTGGGMNLSWQICEAFMMLGHLPPLRFADLPGMAGRGMSKRDRWISAGCLKSAVVATKRAQYTAQRIREGRARAMKEANARRALKAG